MFRIKSNDGSEVAITRRVLGNGQIEVNFHWFGPDGYYQAHRSWSKRISAGDYYEAVDDLLNNNGSGTI